MDKTTSTLLIDFADPVSIGLWQAIGDRVMGGLSSGTLLDTGAGAVFCGSVSLANGGGFASVRCQSEHLDLSAYAGLRLGVRGDGRPYKLSLIVDASFDGVLYQGSFTAAPGEWQSIDLPFAAFVARRRGRTLAGAPALDPAKIQAFGLMTDGRQPGPFRLELRALSAYCGARQA